jgi:hypothetical protein
VETTRTPEEILEGSLQAFEQLLAVTSPVLYGRFERMRRKITGLCPLLGISDPDPINVAALFLQMSQLMLSPTIARTVYYARELSEDERILLELTQDVADQLMAKIPGLEKAREIAQRRNEPFSGDGETSAIESRVLRVAIDFQTLEADRIPAGEALQDLRRRTGAYDPAVIDALARTIDLLDTEESAESLPLSEIQAGMIFDEDVRSRGGMLLVGRGQEATKVILDLLSRIRGADDPIRVTVSRGGKERAG